MHGEVRFLPAPKIAVGMRAFERLNIRVDQLVFLHVTALRRPVIAAL